MPREAGALDRLDQCAKAVTGRGLDGQARGRFERFLELIQLWNRTQNLTALRSPDQIVHGLFEDSLLFLPLIPADSRSIVDIGAGVGVPGIPLAIVDERLKVVLVESRQKRVSFLRTVCRELELGSRVAAVEGRAEGVAQDVVDRFGQFDVAVARAVAATRPLEGIAGPFLRRGGLLISSGPPVSSKPAGAGERIVEIRQLGLERAFFVSERTAP